MDMTPFKRWCCANIVFPGLAFVDGNETSQPVSCHMPGPSVPGSRVFEFMEAHWLVIMFVTLAVVLSVGIFLGMYHMRWRRALQQQLEMGNIDEEQYKRLR